MSELKLYQPTEDDSDDVEPLPLLVEEIVEDFWLDGGYYHEGSDFSDDEIKLISTTLTQLVAYFVQSLLQNPIICVRDMPNPGGGLAVWVQRSTGEWMKLNEAIVRPPPRVSPPRPRSKVTSTKPRKLGLLAPRPTPRPTSRKPPPGVA